MNALTTFDFGAQNVRVVVNQGSPWFVAGDVAAILGYRNAPDMTRNLDDDEAATQIVRSSGQNRELSIISESGLYNAIFRSRRKEAAAFRRWVTGFVLPQIRRTGSFSVNTEDQHKALKLVATCQSLFGKPAAKQLWRDLGLPVPVTSRTDSDDDPLFYEVCQYAELHSNITIDEVLIGMDLTESQVMRRRIGRLLRAAGLYPIVMRTPAKVQRVFVHPQPAQTYRDPSTAAMIDVQRRFEEMTGHAK